MNSKWKYKRIFEVLPGVMSWIIIISPLFLAWFAPKFLAVILLVYISFWLLRTFFMSYRLIIGYRNYRHDIKVNWLKKLENEKFSTNWQDIYHVVLVPTYREDISLLESSIESVLGSNYPMNRVIYVLATEERDRERAELYSKTLSEKYGHQFMEFFTYMHPADIPGEVVGKGPNIYYAAKKVNEFIENRGIDASKVIVTNMDSDNRMDREYLACLTYKYLTCGDPLHKSYQPLPMYFNNIWDVPMAMRLIAMGSSFWQLIVATRPSRLRNFSAHAQTLEALRAVDYWSRETIVEDGHQFWRSYFAFDGNHHVIPLYTPIYQDAVLADNYKETILEQYLQKKRWSWGVSDIPYVMENTIGNKKIPFIDRWANALILWEAHISWATVSIVLATSSWLPLSMNLVFRNQVLIYNFPIIYRYVLIIAWVGMITTLIISTAIVPPRRGKKPIFRIFLDWILTPIVLPISNILLSAIPALHSQTCLMLGRYLNIFRVTVKSVKRSNVS